MAVSRLLAVIPHSFAKGEHSPPRDGKEPETDMKEEEGVIVRQAVIKNVDMSDEMQQDVVNCACEAVESFTIEKDIAGFMKKEFDKKYGPTWHCIVGRNFGSYVTHEPGSFIYLVLGNVAVLLFKSG
ncbi:unnamed protein product [Discosporangium mesarthrocarpum]